MLFSQLGIPRIHDAIDEQDSLMNDGFEVVCKTSRKYKERPKNASHFKADLYAWDSDTTTAWAKDPRGALLNMD
jgi:hypothetical protein